MSKKIRILIVDDHPADFDIAQREIQKSLKASVFKRVQTRQEYLDALSDFQPDIILSDYSLPSFDGITALKLAREHLPLTPFIIWAGSIREDAAVDCMTAGAANYVLKENIKRLAPAVVHAVQERNVALEKKRAEEQILNLSRFPEENPNPVLRVTPEGRILYTNSASRLLLQQWNTAAANELPAAWKDVISTSFDQNVQRSMDITVHDQVYSLMIVPVREAGYVNLYGSDITERKQAEEKLRLQERRFRSLIENSQDSISLLAAEGALIWENPAVEQTLGYEPGKFLSRNIFELMHPDDLAWTSDLFSQVARKSGSQQHGIFRLKHRDGTWRWIEATATNMLQEPSVEAVVINYRDITERKNAEQELRENQDQYQKLVETSHDLIWAVDAQGRFTFVNGAARDIYGYEPEELIGRFYFDILDPDHDPLTPETFREALSGRNGYHEHEVYVRHRDGRQIILSANSIVLRDLDGTVIGMTGTSRDITEHKRAQEALRTERNLLRTLIDHLPDRIYAMDKQGRKTMSNTADWQASGGKTMENVIGKTNFDLYPPELAEPFWQVDHEVLKSGQPVINYEEPGLDPEGHWVSVLTSKIPLRDESGNVIGLVSIGRDITERKNAEAQIRDLHSFNEKILDESPLGILSYKLTGECIYANERAAAMIGATVEGLRAQNFHTIPSWKTSGLYALAEKAISSQTLASSDIHLISTFGREIWMAARCVLFQANEEQHLLLSMSDITERKLAEEALRENERRYRTLFEEMPTAIWEEDFSAVKAHLDALKAQGVTDLGAFLTSHPEQVQLCEDLIRILDVNYTAVEMYRAGTKERLIRETLEETSRGEQEHGIEDLLAIAESRTSNSWEGADETCDGAPLEIRLSWSVVPGHEKDFSKVIVTTIDMTENKRVAQAEREQRALAEALRDTAQLLNSTLDYGEVLDHILSTAERVAPHNAGTIMLIEDGFARVVRSHGYDKLGIKDEILGIRLPLSDTRNLRRMLETGQPVIISDTHTYPGWKRMEVTDWLRSSVGAPISIRDEVIGFILLDSETPGFFTPLHGERLKSFANQAALAIHNARLLQQAREEIAERRRAETELHRKNEDLRLLNLINNAVVRGQDLDSIIELLARELKRIFSAVGSTIYMLSADKRSLMMRQYSFSPDIEKRIEKLIGFRIPKIDLPIKEGSHFHNALLTKQSVVTTDPQKIQERIAEFVETKSLPSITRPAVRRLIPHIFKLLKIRSTITFPLIFQEEVVGFLDVSSASVLTQADMKRIEAIAEQLTSLVQRQQVNEKVHKSEKFLQGIQNSLSAHIAILDKDGTIVQVNEAWREFGDQNGLRNSDYCIGTNYIAVCESAAGPDAEAAKEIATAIHRVLSGETGAASIEYSAHSPAQKRWFIVHITCFDDGKQKWVILAHENITERKLIEEELQQSENRYRTVVENQTEFIVRWKEDGTHTFVNDAYCRYYGITAEQARHANFMALIHEDDRQIVQEKRTRLLSRVSSVETDSHRVRKPDGSIGWNEWTDQAIYDEDGQLLEFQSVGRDITEHKRAEIALRESEQRYRTLFEDMPIAIWEEDFSDVKAYLDSLKAQGIVDIAAYLDSHPNEVRTCQNLIKILDVNHSAVEMYRAGSKERLIRVSLQESSHGEQEYGLGDLVAIAAGRPGNSWEGVDKTCDGTTLEIRLCWSVVPGHEQDYSKVVVTTLDITDRKRSEQELKLSHSLLYATLESTADGILVVDSEGRITNFNQKFLELWHVHQELASQKDDQVLLEFVLKQLKDPDAFLAKVEALYQSPEDVSWDELEFLDGRVFERFSQPQRLGGACVGRVWSFRDITERKQAEAALQQSQARYHDLFDKSPISLWEEDYSLVKQRVDALRERGITDFTEYFDQYPEQIFELASLVRIIDVNRESLNLFRTPRKEDLLKNLSAILNENVLPHFREELLGLLSPIRGFVWEGTDKTVDGQTLDLIVMGTIPSGYEEDWSRVIVSIVDITERKHAEDELRASEERFRQLATNIEEVFWMTDAKSGRELYASPAVKKIWGFSLETLLQEPGLFLKSVLPADRSIVLSSIEREKMGEKVEMEYRIVHSDGSVRWIWDRAFPVFDEHGNVKILAGISADITQRKQIELESQRHLAELEALYENGLAIGRLLEPREIGNQIIETFARYLSWHHVVIRLLDPETDALELIAFNQPGLSDEARAEAEMRFTTMVSKIGQGLSGLAMRTGKSIRTGNVHTYPQYVNAHQGIVSGLYMPLEAGERVIGCISVESDKPDAFTVQDERLLATLANQAAIAFANARLYQSMQQELSERQRAQQALWASETHYRQLADSITDILFELDQDLRYTHWNKASEMFSGIPAADVIGKSMQEIEATGIDIFKHPEIYKSVLKERQAKIFEINASTQGQKRNFEISAYPSARGVSVVARDITERKLSESLLRKRFELIEYSNDHSLADVMQKVVDEVSALTASHIGFLHLVEADETTISLQAWSTETIERHCRVEGAGAGMHYPLDQAGVWADAVRQRRPVVHDDYESLPDKRGLPDGHARVTREMVIPIIRNDRISAMLGVGNKEQEYTQQDIEVATRFADYAWDITERRRIESELAEERNQLARRVEERTADLSRANSNLARALRVKDEFLANMSHELRTPLNAILGLSESLSEQVAGPLNEKQSRYLSTINESGHHLLALINDILDLAKIEARQITLDINKVDVNLVCQASLRMIKQLAQKKSQNVSFEIGPNLGLIWADERRLKQMIVNLLSNAVKFTPESGKLGLQVHGDEDANIVNITVWDEGIGISENDLQRLFRPFIQLDAGLAREATGTGLGLALVAQMAQLHGGSVIVDSRPGNGSSFTIRLPWQPAMAGESMARLRSTGKFRAINPDEVRPTVLLIEDTQEVVMMLVDYLEMVGFNMVTAQDGIDGLTQAKIAHPDLILMDIQMPRMDGFETTEKLRSDPEFKETPIIALTALAMPNDRQRCLDAGMNEYLSKPVNLKALSKTIKAFLFESEGNSA